MAQLKLLRHDVIVALQFTERLGFKVYA